MADGQVGSILLVDCGSTTTKAVLFELADGQYRMVSRSQAPSTIGAPWRDITAGIYHAVEQISQISGREIVDPDGRLILPERGGGQGVDLMAATVSAAPPLRVVAAGLSSEISLASARRAVRATYCRLVDQIAVDESPRRKDSQWLQAVQAARPEVILLVGGVDGGEARPVLEMARLMALAVQLDTERPPMIYAGNAALRTQIASLLGDQVELRAVDNVRPSLDQENLTPVGTELAHIFGQTVMSQLPGLSLLKQWSNSEPLPTAQGFGQVIRYLDHLCNKPRHGVLGIDLGGMTTTVAAARDGQFSLTVLTELGMGSNLGNLLRQVPLEQLVRWLPEETPPNRVSHLLMNKSLRPWTVSHNMEELMIEQAAARELLTLALVEARQGWPLRGRQQSPVVNEIVGSGSTLCHAPTPGHAALMLLDTVQPAFFTSRLVLDKTGVLPAVGALAAIQPAMAAQILEQDGLLDLGSAISPVGLGRHGEKVLSFKVRSALGTYEGDVRFGSLERIIVPTGVKATLELRPSSHFDLGMGPGRGVEIKTWGGVLGIVIDARGRPLIWPEKPEQRQRAIRRWLAELGAWSPPTAPEPVEVLGDL